MAYLVDYHIHTEFSVDAEGSPGEFARAALDAGLSEICFTDHVDLLGYDEGRGFFKPRPYLDTLAATREEMAGRLLVKAGMELGVEPEIIDKVIAVAGQDYFSEFDYVIGSVHGVEGRLLGNGYFGGKSRREACSRYLQDLSTAVCTMGPCHAIDVIGHLDLVKRYAPWQPGERWLDEARDIFETVIGTIVEHGIGLELNTSGFRQRPLEQFPCVEILNIYRQRGGEILSIGSDAHSPGTLKQSAAFCRTALDIMGAAGFRYFTTFDRRKPSFLPLE